jgi:sugar-specific transcriptional regulator TrmB
MVEYVRPRERIEHVRYDEAGRAIKMTATRGHPNQPGHWTIDGETPYGEKWTETINGSPGIVTLRMSNMADERWPEFKQAATRGDRPRQRMLSDRNVSVSDLDPQVYNKR